MNLIARADIEFFLVEIDGRRLRYVHGIRPQIDYGSGRSDCAIATPGQREVRPGDVVEVEVSLPASADPLNQITVGLGFSLFAGPYRIAHGVFTVAPQSLSQKMAS